MEKDWAKAKGRVAPWGQAGWEKVKENVRRWGVVKGNSDTRSLSGEEQTEHWFGETHKWKIHDWKELFNPVAEAGHRWLDPRVATCTEIRLAKQSGGIFWTPLKMKPKWKACLMLEYSTSYVLTVTNAEFVTVNVPFQPFNHFNP